MADEVYVDVDVSDCDRLTARSFHHALVRLVDSLAEQGEHALQVNVPKGETERLLQAVARGEVIDGEFLITSEVGVHEISGIGIPGVTPAAKDIFSPGQQSSSMYPLFVDRGTGIFGPAHAPIHARRVGVMRWEENGKEIFAKETKGQEGQEFMAKTYAEMIGLLAGEVEIFKVRVHNELAA